MPFAEFDANRPENTPKVESPAETCVDTRDGVI